MLKKYRFYDKDLVSASTAIVHTGESETIQSEKDNCDINVIMKRFGVTGVVPQIMDAKPIVDRFGEVFDFQSAMNAVREAEEKFMEMPSKIRQRFQNNPGVYLEFMSDPKNVDEMVSMGLATKVAVPEPKATE